MNKIARFAYYLTHIIKLLYRRFLLIKINSLVLHTSGLSTRTNLEIYEKFKILSKI